MIALVLSDALCVARHRKPLMEFIREHVDLLLGTDEEMAKLSSDSEDLKRLARMIVITRGGQGAQIIEATTETLISAEPVDSVVDTTGAGDWFCAGLIYGLIEGWSLQCAGQLAARCGAQAVAQLGTFPPDNLREAVMPLTAGLN
jgi:sugar/nucleoside kinase (ribokinase family)